MIANAGPVGKSTGPVMFFRLGPGTGSTCSGEKCREISVKTRFANQFDLFWGSAFSFRKGSRSTFLSQFP